MKTKTVNVARCKRGKPNSGVRNDTQFSLAMKAQKVRKAVEKRKKSTEVIDSNNINSVGATVPVPVNGNGILILKIPLCLAKIWEEHGSNEEVAQIKMALFEQLMSIELMSAFVYTSVY